MTRKDKIQHLLIMHLLEEGVIKLALPDQMEIELGIIKEDKKTTNLVKKDNYSWVIVSQKNREVSIDSYNLGLRFPDQNGKLLIEDSRESVDGEPMRCFSVI